MTAFVIDASAGIDLLLNNSSGRSLARKLPPTSRWWAPEHYFVEVGNFLRRQELAGTVPSARIAVAFQELRAGSVHRVQVRPLMDAAWAKRGHLTFADAPVRRARRTARGGPRHRRPEPRPFSRPGGRHDHALT